MNNVATGMVLVACLVFGVQTHAEVVSSAPDHFTLQLVAESSLSPEQVWARLIEPSQWWQSDHTYSGHADNLSLDPVAGGLWREDWEGGSVQHGRVLTVQDGELLRLSAPFGPLQGLAVQAIWTITLAPSGTGTLITFDHVTNGTSASQLQRLAPAVDAVKRQALTNLARESID